MVTRNVIFLCFSFFFIAVQGANLALNPSFESGTTSWTAYGNGYTIDTTSAQSGTSSLYCSTTGTTTTKGAYQVVTLNQATAASITISAYARASGALTGTATGTFALYADIQLMSGAWVYGVQVAFSGTTTTWEAKSFTTSPGAIATVWVYCLFRNIQGNVWFDNVYVGPTTGAPTVAPTPVTSTTATGTTTTTKSATTGGASAGTTGSTTKSATTGGSTTGTAPTPAATIAPTPAATSAPTPAPAAYYTLGLKYLIIAPSTSDIRLIAAQRTFDAVGAQYDVAITTEVAGNFSLTNTDGSGKYLGFVYTLDVLTLPAAQQQQLVAYQAKFYTKSVTMYTYPYANNGVTSALNAGSTLGNLTFASAASGFTSGYNPNAIITSDGTYAYPATITDATIAQPAMYITYPSAPTTKYVIAAFVTHNNSTRELQFFLDQASWCVHTTALGMFWLQWMSNNLYLGMRRIYLNCQVDDLFMDSDEWDTKTQSEPELYSYRITAAELQTFADWQVTTNARLPAGSNITIAFPFNGATVADYGGVTKDALYLKTKALINSFTFMTHTFDHPELNAPMNYATAKKEITDNYVITLQLFGSLNHARYANASMVTPSISGIFNGPALQALWDCGIRHLVGDNSRIELQTPFAYHGFYTTVATNGFAGMYIVPREATSMYYDNTLPAETVSEYNHMYNLTMGISTFDQIVDRESTRVANLLLAFRHDPYMFHQANLRAFSYNGKTTSLLAHWVDMVLAKFTQYYSLPVHAHTQDLMSQKWLDREARDACGFSGTVKVATATKKIISISGITTKSCQMAITGAKVAASTTVSSEVYGPDTTVWVKTTANQAFTLTLTTQIQM